MLLEDLVQVLNPIRFRLVDLIIISKEWKFPPYVIYLHFLQGPSFKTPTLTETTIFMQTQPLLKQDSSQGKTHLKAFAKEATFQDMWHTGRRHLATEEQTALQKLLWEVSTWPYHKQPPEHRGMNQGKWTRHQAHSYYLWYQWWACGHWLQTCALWPCQYNGPSWFNWTFGLALEVGRL